MRFLLLFLLSLSSVRYEQNTLAERFAPPTGFEREPAAAGSFAAYLRALPLKPEGATVRYYNGATKPSQGRYAAVIDLPIGTRNLHQCADAVMRLRADYLYAENRKADISFNLTNGFAVPYARWAKGERVGVEGNRTWWKQSATAADNPTVYWKYLEFIWSYAGTASLEKELTPKAVADLQAGDVFIKGGYPGHAVMVVDRVENADGEVRFMLAQSYMPAQELQVLTNPQTGGVWYSLPSADLRTPEWTFGPGSLRTWPKP